MCPTMRQGDAGTVFVMPKRSSKTQNPSCDEPRQASDSGVVVSPISHMKASQKSKLPSGLLLSMPNHPLTHSLHNEHRLYVGTHEHYAVVVCDFEAKIPQTALRPRNDLHDYASFYGWGCDHESVLQLALALLADTLGSDRRALLLHKWFAARVISRMDATQGWVLSQSQTLEMVREYEEKNLHFWSDDAQAYIEEAIP